MPMLALLIPPLMVAAAAEPAPSEEALDQQPLSEESYIVTLQKDCTCYSEQFSEGLTPLALKKGYRFDQSCKTNPAFAHCSTGFAERTSCPKTCVKLEPYRAITAQEIETSRTAAESRMVETYKKDVPAPILSLLQDKFPGWKPLLLRGKTNEATRQIEWKSPRIFHEGPARIRGKTETLAIVLFVQKGVPQWAFFDARKRTLIHSNQLPFKFEEGYWPDLFLVPRGDSQTEAPTDSYFHGMALGVSDATPCCGPYYFNELDAKSGPKLGDPGTTDNPYGKPFWNAKTARVDGPANVRAMPMSSAVVVCSLDDGAPVTLQTRGGERNSWFYVEDQNRSCKGYTHLKNIKPPLPGAEAFEPAK